MADTSTPDRRISGQRNAKTGSYPTPRRSTIALLRQFARLYPAMGSAPIGVYIAN